MATRILCTRPLYLQVRDTLAERIAMGIWKPGTPLPNEGDLARECGVSAGTMRKALDILESERLVTRRQGRGTFVNDQASGEFAIRYTNIRGSTGERITGKVQAVEVSEGKADAQERARLRLKEQDAVYRVRCVRLQDDQPFMVEETSMPAAIFPGLLENSGFLNHIAILAQQHGVLLGKAEERISIDLATSAVAKALRVDPSSPILVLDRVLRTARWEPNRVASWSVPSLHASLLD